MTPEEEKIAEEILELAEKVALEDTSPEGLMRNAELARQVAEEVYQSDDDSDKVEVDMSNIEPGFNPDQY